MGYFGKHNLFTINMHNIKAEICLFECIPCIKQSDLSCTSELLIGNIE